MINFDRLSLEQLEQLRVIAEVARAGGEQEGFSSHPTTPTAVETEHSTACRANADETQSGREG